MATLREFILQQSTLAAGNTVRDHINNPGAGLGLTLFDGLEVEMECSDFDVEVDSGTLEVAMELGADFEVELELTEFEVEVC